MSAQPTEAMIEAGIEARDKIHNAMHARNLSDAPENMPDYDDGDVMSAIYLAMIAASPPAGELPSDAVERVCVIEMAAGRSIETFERRVKERKGRLTWWAVNELQDNMAAIKGEAGRILTAIHKED